MANRFPSVEQIRSKLTISSDSPNYYPCMAGAMTGMYNATTQEFEKLRALASASLEGSEESREDLRRYLDHAEGVAELYAIESDMNANGGICAREAVNGRFHIGGAAPAGN